MAYAAVIIAAIGAAAASAAGASAFKSAQANQRMLEMEADTIDKQAEYVLEKGDFEASRIRLDSSRILGSQASSYAAQGANAATGSSALMAESSDRLAEEDVKRLKLNAAMDAWGLRNNAKGVRFAGDQAVRNARTSAIAKIFGGAADVGSAYVKSQGSK
jgi:hypothetical protein